MVIAALLGLLILLCIWAAVIYATAYIASSAWHDAIKKRNQ